MILHPLVRQVIERLEALELHAAQSGREVMHALARVAADSRAASAEELASEIEAAVDALLEVLPPYAPPLNVMHLVMARVEGALANGASAAGLKVMLVSEAEQFKAWSEAARRLIACYGSEVIHDGATVFTFTLSETALRTLQEARRRGRVFRVLLTESRPNNDGLVTAAQLAELGVSVGVDACVGELLPQADVMIVGAEAIMVDGSAVCKVGTYPAALAARVHGVPVFVVVDTLKFNTVSMFGLPSRMDPLRRSDVLPSDGVHNKQVQVVGHLFDRTPAELIRGIVTERGVMTPTACTVVMREMPLSARLNAKLLSRYVEQ